jgi:CysZ protein
MSVFQGISYQFRGLRLALQSPRLLALGLLRFVVIVLITIAAASIALYYHRDITELLWVKPQSAWVAWLWHVVSWLVALLLVGVSAIISFLIAQVLFSVIIMDTMSRITEKMVTSSAQPSPSNPLLKQFLYLVRQEIPRNTLPVMLTLVIMLLGWATPLGPIITALSSAVAIVFLAWDNTDLVPARRMDSFSTRFAFLTRNLGFHLGFGLVFLIPGINIIFLSYAPVGATLWYIEKVSR